MKIIKLFWSKHKRIILIVFAVVFLVALFFLKNGWTFKNQIIYQGGSGENGLSYSNAIIGDLVNKDTDGDGIPDWEESLWGTDPTKKETTPGIPDSVAISKMKATEEQGAGTASGTGGGAQAAENLTKTDEFSRELFSTVAALNQNGAIDQATVDKISSSLADHIQNSPQRKVFALSDIKIIKDDSAEAIKNYDYALKDIYTKYQTNGSIANVFQEFAPDQNTVNVDVLAKLDPIITQTNKIIAGIAKTNVPLSLSLLHLELLNVLERSVENLSDIKLYDTDAIVALGAISQYSANSAALETAANNLTNAIKQKWQN